jgi:hypothetical protein
VCSPNCRKGALEAASVSLALMTRDLKALASVRLFQGVWGGGWGGGRGER